MYIFSFNVLRALHTHATCRGIIFPQFYDSDGLANISQILCPFSLKLRVKDMDLVESVKGSPPASGLAASADFTSLLPDELQEKYPNKNQVLQEDSSSSRSAKHFRSIRDNDDRTLIQKLENVGLMTLVKRRPKVLNGVFAVPKGEKDEQRLIIDARKANSFFAAPLKIEFRNPGHFARLYLPDEQKLYGAKSDMDNQYHRMRIPVWLRTFLGLPKVNLEGQLFYPVVN